jgi:hypothetical protein
VGVPDTVPVEELIESPGGSVPPADALVVAVDEESEDATVSGVMAVPDTFVWAPGPVTVTVLVTVHVNDVEPTNPAESVTATDTG